MTMMHFVRPAYGAHISIIGAGKPFKALVNDHIVHHEISKAIGHYAKAYCLQPVHFAQCTEKNTKKARHREDDEEGIVLFKKTGLRLMMILVQVPEQTMHDVFMRKPGNAFHDNESANQYGYVG